MLNAPGLRISPVARAACVVYVGGEVAVNAMAFLDDLISSNSWRLRERRSFLIGYIRTDSERASSQRDNGLIGLAAAGNPYFASKPIGVSNRSLGLSECVSAHPEPSYYLPFYCYTTRRTGGLSEL